MKIEREAYAPPLPERVSRHWYFGLDFARGLWWNGPTMARLLHVEFAGMKYLDTNIR